MKLELETTDDLILRCARCGSAFVLVLLDDELGLGEPDLVLPGDCASCYHQLDDGLCACREPEDMPELDCPDWSPK